MNPIQSAWHGLIGRLFGRDIKAASDAEFIPADRTAHRGLPLTSFAYERKIRGGLDSNVVMSPVNWISRNFTEAELIVESRESGMWEPVREHDVLSAVERPNPFYGEDLLWKATLVSFFLDGNAYWRKIRSRLGRVVQLRYVPHFLIDPKAPEDGSEFISHYEYRPDRRRSDVIELDVDDVVHFRHGLDPADMRLGLSPIRPILREVFTDEEAANFSASILRNMGVPGGIIAPKDANSTPSPEDVEEMKAYMKSGFTGDRRGEWLVLGTPTHTEQFGFDPNQLMLGNLRDIAEERVCAALGIPAAVVGFGAGLQQTKVGATMRELVRLARVNCVEPNQSSIAKQATRQLLPEFVQERERDGLRLQFDNRNVSMFQEDLTDMAKRAVILFDGGLISRDEGREMVNFPPSGDDSFADPHRRNGDGVGGRLSEITITEGSD